MAISPYQNKQQSEWKSITEELITNYPLSTDEILEISLIAWEKLWGTEVGGTIKLVEVDLPATVIGYFFQKLFSYELSKRYPNEWKGEKEKSDKDLVNIKNPTFSTEMKASGQLGYKIFGNRSYNQQGFNEETTGKDKSGFYITINFYSQTLTLISIGWIDQNDWNSQEEVQRYSMNYCAYRYKDRNMRPLHLLSLNVFQLRHLDKKMYYSLP